MANTGQYDSQTNIETEDSELEITMQPEAATVYGGSVVNSINGQVGDVVLTTSDLENTSDYQTGAQVQSAIAGKQDKLTAGTNIQINNDVISATDTTYSAGSGLDLDGTTFSVDTNTIATVQDVTNEATIRENSDANLQGQIDALLDSKQNVIADLPQIRSGAEAGATAVQPEDLARIATTGSYNDSLDKPSINNVTLTGNKSLDALGIQPKGNYALESEIPDVSNFITNTVDNLVNYYKKSETFTKQEVNDLISAITTMDVRVVQTLPTEDISTTTIYLVPKTTAEQNDAYDEYLYVSNAWEHIGSTEVDLTNYVTNTDYPTGSKAGVIRTNPDYGTSITSVGALISATKTYQQYQETTTNNMFISKGTLENVITGKGLVSNTDYASSNTAGVIRLNTSGYGTSVDPSGALRVLVKTYEQYKSSNSYCMIGKGTLENVITGKELDLKQLSTFDSTKTQVLKNINGSLIWVDE